MRLATTKNVPPRRTVRLGEIPLSFENPQIVGVASAPACVGNYVVYMVLAGIVALAGATLVAGDSFAFLRARDIAGAARSSPQAGEYFHQHSEQEGAHIVVGKLLGSEERENRAGRHDEQLAQFSGKKFATSIERLYGQQDEQRRHRGHDVLSLGAVSGHGATFLGEGPTFSPVAAEVSRV